METTDQQSEIITKSVEGHDRLPIIMLALPKHDDAFTSTPYQLAGRFAQERKVWYISHPYTWMDFFKNIKDKAIRKRWKASWPRGYFRELTADGVQILYLPLTLPINGLPPGRLYNLFSWVNHQIVRRAIKRMLKKENIDSYIFVNSHDFYFGRLQRFLPGNFHYVYHCIDPIIKAYSARHGNYLEKEAAKEADIVISTSPFLQRKMAVYNKKSYCVPNAANFRLSHMAHLPQTTILPKVAAIEGVKIGYIGNIERRINYEWLTSIFTKHPEWQLVMVGPKDDTYIPVSFLGLPNLHLLPPVPHHQLPSVLKGFDVAMIPFKKDEVSSQIYPLKLFEYMGSGKPVVTTDFNEEVITPFKDLVYLGTSLDSMEEAIQQALQEDNIAMVEERIEQASQNDWTARGHLFLEYINQMTYARQL